MNRQFATVISRIFDPFVMLVALLLLALMKSSLTGVAQVRALLLTSLLMIGLPASLLYIAIKKKIVSNWDISNRMQRPRVLIAVLVLEVVNVFLLRGIIDPFLFRMFLFISVIMTGFTAVTFYWKISGHTCMSALATGLAVLWYGWSWWPFFLIVPLLGWARVYRHDHTVAQAVVGAVYAWGLIALFHGFL